MMTTTAKTAMTREEIAFYAILSIGDTVYTADRQTRTTEELTITAIAGYRDTAGNPVLTYTAANDTQTVTFTEADLYGRKVFLYEQGAAVMADCPW